MFLLDNVKVWLQNFSLEQETYRWEGDFTSLITRNAQEYVCKAVTTEMQGPLKIVQSPNCGRQKSNFAITGPLGLVRYKEKVDYVEELQHSLLLIIQIVGS